MREGECVRSVGGERQMNFKDTILKLTLLGRQRLYQILDDDKMLLQYCSNHQRRSYYLREASLLVLDRLDISRTLVRRSISESNREVLPFSFYYYCFFSPKPPRMSPSWPGFLRPACCVVVLLFLSGCFLLESKLLHNETKTAE